eukprot:7235965-Alexandrium_andersonii.AAC.1
MPEKPRERPKAHESPPKDGQKEKFRVTAPPPKPDKSRDPSAPVIITFKDGDKWACSDVTWADLAPQQKHLKREAIWTGVHQRSHNSLCIKPRPEKGLELLVLYEQRQQVQPSIPNMCLFSWCAGRGSKWGRKETG